MAFRNIQLNDGHSMPVIAYGTGTILRDKDVSNWIVEAVEMGFSHIDTAQMYNNEDSVGDGLRKSGLLREDLFITTKYHSGSIQEAIRTSLRKLGLEYVDLYLIHIPEPIKDDFEGAWRDFEKIKEDGLARSIGVSNFNVEQLQAIMKIAKIKPVVNQISLNPYNYSANKLLLEYASEQGIVIQAYNILAPITRFPGGPMDVPVNAAAKRLGITPGQVIFLWARAKSFMIVTTSTKRERIQEYLGIRDLPSLTEEEVVAIDEVGAVHAAQYRHRPY